LDTPDCVNQKLSVESVSKKGRPLEIPKKKMAKIRRSNNVRRERALWIISGQI
jgi:hypothetical protein